MPCHGKKLAVVIAVFALFAVFAVFAPAAARAEDFNFTVPIRLTKVQSNYSGGSVGCYLHANEATARRGPSDIYGVNVVRFDLTSDGNLAADHLEIKVNVKPGRSAADITHYNCILFLYDPRVGGVDLDPCSLSRPGSTCVKMVYGPIPRITAAPGPVRRLP